jgi:hypothetical protein
MITLLKVLYVVLILFSIYCNICYDKEILKAELIMWQIASLVNAILFFFNC